MVNIVEKHEPRKYSAMCTNNGVVLCDKLEGSFLVLRCDEDLFNLKELLSKINVVELDEEI